MPLLAAAVVLGARRLDRVRAWLVAALACSTAGDALLLSPSDAAFVCGALAFALAHAAYIVCFTLAGSGRGLVRRCPWAALPYVASWIAATVFVAPHMGALAIVAVPYGALVTAMAIAALNLIGRAPPDAALPVAAGAALFLCSDSTIAIARFVPAFAPPRAEFMIMALYLGAQTLLASGIARSGSR